MSNSSAFKLTGVSLTENQPHNEEQIVSSLRDHTAELASIALEQGISLGSTSLLSSGNNGRPYDIAEIPSSDYETNSEDGDSVNELERSQDTSNLREEDGAGPVERNDRYSTDNDEEADIETTSLLSAGPDRRTSIKPTSGTYHTFNGTFRDPWSEGSQSNQSRTLRSYISQFFTKKLLTEKLVKKPVRLFPSVFVGLLLNILDGLSYGMILFPIGSPLFSHLGPAGLSMFYVSCIVSQLVYSLGGSAFKSGVGSEMIEIVPFFHSMAFSINDRLGTESQQSVIPTTILSFALSSIVTGLVFFLLGRARLGSIVGFFPRHILIGCVGGVGFFLMITGVEVSSRMTTSLKYNMEVFRYLFMKFDVLMKWMSSVVLAAVLMLLEKKIHSPLLLPVYFISLFIMFHLTIWLVPNFSLEEARSSGWMFPMVESNEPWWFFYTLYDFKKVNYLALLDTIPAMFALTFFGLLHVPINVPALAVSIGVDDIDVDRELIAHGISNALSGLVGSIQNYLVYTNSVLFIKSGANSRLAGVMLAIATSFVMFAGPGVIGFIPVMVVGSLIFLLGFELLAEALIDPWGKVSRYEYLTIVVIVFTMGIWDFVYGIILGIILACVLFVVNASQVNVVKATYTGDVARSTVRRHYTQQEFLHEVGKQIYVMKLSGYVFFGTIVVVEKQVKSLMDDASFRHKPIRFLVLDISLVTDIDYSAAEAFARMKRLLDSRRVTLILAGASESSKCIRQLKAVRLIDGSHSELNRSQHVSSSSVQVNLFPDLNTALEYCENEFLVSYYKKKESLQRRQTRLSIPSRARSESLRGTSLYSSPRAVVLQNAVTQAAKSEVQSTSKWQHFKPPLPVMMQAFQNVSNKNEDFWFKIAPYFNKLNLEGGTILYRSETEATGFYIVESGMLRADYDLAQGKLYESILAGTTCGELPFFSHTSRTATVKAEKNSIVWKLDAESWRKLRESQPNGLEMANELLEVALKLTVERFTSVTSYVMMSTGS